MCAYEHVHGTRDHVNANSGIAYTLSRSPGTAYGQLQKVGTKRKLYFPDLKMANAIFSFRHFYRIMTESRTWETR